MRPPTSRALLLIRPAGNRFLPCAVFGPRNGSIPIGIPRRENASTSHRTDKCPKGSTDGCTCETPSYRSGDSIFKLGLLSPFRRQRSICLSIPRSRCSCRHSTLIAVALNTRRKEVVQVICATFCTGFGMFDVPRAASSLNAVVFSRKLFMTQMTIASRTSINCIELLFSEWHRRQSIADAIRFSARDP
jgi:hypothetical protein